MFIGHYGAGLSFKKAAPPISLGLLFIAVQFLDLLWPTFLLLHIEHVEISTDKGHPIPLIFTDYPWSHSLLMALVWSALFFGLYGLVTKNVRYALVLGLAVSSHWVLDFVVHVPDLPLYPGSSIKLGLQLWRYPVVANIVEGLIFFTGVFIYVKATKARNRTGVIVFWALIALFLISHIVNLFSPPPPSVDAIAWAGQAMWLFVVLGFWADKNRVAR